MQTLSAINFQRERPDQMLSTAAHNATVSVECVFPVKIRKFLNPEDITVAENRRPLQEEIVLSLMDSIREIGLQHPVAVLSAADGKHHLVAGAHRVDACRRLGEMVEAAVFDDELEARIWEIDENFARAELSPEQRRQHIAERVRLTQEKVLAEPTPCGGRQQPAEKAIRKTAAALNLDPSIISRAAAAESLPEEIKKAANEAGLNTRERAKVAAARPEVQKEKVSELAAAKRHRKPNPSPALQHLPDANDQRGPAAEAPMPEAPTPGPAQTQDEGQNAVNWLADLIIAQVPGGELQQASENLMHLHAIGGLMKVCDVLHRHQLGTRQQPAGLLTSGPEPASLAQPQAKDGGSHAEQSADRQSAHAVHAAPIEQDPGAQSAKPPEVQAPPIQVTHAAMTDSHVLEPPQPCPLCYGIVWWKRNGSDWRCRACVAPSQADLWDDSYDESLSSAGRAA
ncbi:MAG: ParB N-terminal domain-containing protein [Acetobacteraceae bacterium]|nr:ParB N-terminal domain-containing protein [Acetobacteraceae bacterium]